MLYAFFNKDGRIDQAVNDSTCDELPVGAKELTTDQWEIRFDLLLVNNEITVSPQGSVLSSDQLIKQFSNVIQKRINDFAATRLYDKVDSMTKYKDITDDEIQSLPVDVRDLVAKFKVESRYLILKTAETWAKCYLILDQFQITGKIPTEEELIGQLPTLEWPN